MDSKIIFFEGQPGTGKSTISQYICEQLQLNGESVRWVDEYEHNAIQFSRFWEKYDNCDEDFIDVLVSCWEELINTIEESEHIFIIESAFFSYTLYLMNLEFSKEKINNYFKKLNIILSKLNPQIILLKGDTETIIRRACERRGNQWTNMTIDMIEKGPYQYSRKRVGFKGMVEYFSDAQKLYFELMPLINFPILQIDVTEDNWITTENVILSWLGDYTIQNHYHNENMNLKIYVGKYQVPKEFPAKGENLEIFFEDNLLVLKGTYWEDYKLSPRSETKFLIKGIPMEVNFKLKEGKIKGFDYTFIDRNTYFCSKIE
ncbi:hypothetical protein IO99_06745 [Clostridium sulfidigenes]|uniref:Uncharacterized protein n=1 Tax=Clostridium sulfidigenes TaxID=318464 RepID=A0A084JE80_9CLOT|nr:AAA family ATPase [Clostridium sulfidigenes]KEZ87264.1 hypothetical protein IO99_06745 [Clostridium sulfidigenes]